MNEINKIFKEKKLENIKDDDKNNLNTYINNIKKTNTPLYIGVLYLKEQKKNGEVIMIKNGEVIMIENGEMYKGHWTNDTVDIEKILLENASIKKYDDKTIYFGQIENGKKHGFGILYDENAKKIITGNWKNNTMTRGSIKTGLTFLDIFSK